MKENIRAMGFDDGYFKERRGTTVLVGVLMRPGVVEGIVVSEVTVDGDDATDTLLSLLSGRIGRQANVVFTNGIVFGGTNILDMERLVSETGKPFIAIVRKRPNQEDFLRVLERSAPWKAELARRLGTPVQFQTKKGNIYVNFWGIEKEEAKRVIERFQVTSSFPEPLRLAHLIATAITRGESRGPA